MKRSPLRLALSLLAVVVIIAIRYARDETPAAPSASPAPVSAIAEPPAQGAPSSRSTAEQPSRSPTGGNDAIVAAFRARRSDVWVEGKGTVEAILPDDREGSRHQKFIVRIDRDLTILVSHNIDLAPRAPLDKGDRVSFRGEYVWNAKGGLVHWTHHDPGGRPGGWIRLGDEIYE